jgi:hypothetical protein
MLILRLVIESSLTRYDHFSWGFGGTGVDVAGFEVDPFATGGAVAGEPPPEVFGVGDDDWSGSNLPIQARNNIAIVE